MYVILSPVFTFVSAVTASPFTIVAVFSTDKPFSSSTGVFSSSGSDVTSSFVAVTTFTNSVLSFISSNFTVYSTVIVLLAPGVNVPIFKSPVTSKLSSTLTFSIVLFPVFVTVIVYVILSPVFTFVSAVIASLFTLVAVFSTDNPLTSSTGVFVVESFSSPS